MQVVCILAHHFKRLTPCSRGIHTLVTLCNGWDLDVFFAAPVLHPCTHTERRAGLTHMRSYKLHYLHRALNDTSLFLFVLSGAWARERNVGPQRYITLRLTLVELSSECVPDFIQFRLEIMLQLRLEIMLCLLLYRCRLVPPSSKAEYMCRDYFRCFSTTSAAYERKEPGTL